METLLRDLRQAIRAMRQGGGSFTLTAVIALAVGIGANTAIFSLVNTVLLREPPFPKSDRIVIFETKGPQGSFQGASPAKFAHWAQQTEAFEDVSAFGGGVVNWTGGAFPQQLRSERVSSAYFRLFGVPVIKGRAFNAQEDMAGAAPVVLIGEGLWKSRFGSDPNIVGRTMVLGGEPHVITGVVGRRFDFQDFGPAPDLWIPFQLDPNSRDQGHYFQAAGRLKDGVSLIQAKARLDASASAYRQKFPDGLDHNQSFDAGTLRELLVQGAEKSIWVLAAAVGFVLLIACANVANLLLARAEVRKRELAIRAALGAGRLRIVRQLLTESLLLAAAGAVLGTVLGLVGIRALLSVNTAGLPRVGTDGALVSPDWRVLLFTIAITLVTTLIFGLLPAWRAARTDLSATIKESASRSGSGFRQNKVRTILVVSEVALAVILLVGAGLLIRTAVAIYAVRPGFDTKNVLTMRMSLAGKSYETSTAIENLIRQAVERLEALPGVELASATCCVPLEGGYGLPFRVIGRPLQNGPFHGGGGWKTVSPGYFEVFKIPIVRGRSFTERDNHSGAPVVIINESMAKRFWPKGDPLQDRILIGKPMMPELDAEQPRQIIGIAADQRDGSLNQDPQPEMYISNGQATDAIQALNVKLTPLAWVIRTRGEPMKLRAPVEEVLRQVTGLPVSDVRAMDEVVSRSTSRERFHMLLMSVFGGVSLLLAAIGIYGLMAYSVEQRTQEIGIRMALGAERGDVRGMVMRQGMIFAALGVILGIVGAFALAKQIASFLFGVTAWDPLVFGIIPAVLLVTAVLAIWWPANRATRVDPATALRQS
ncbi:MAG TPA: ABC transporter permease [Bryobacteraceae bacterium]|jgi:predicted permease|nr:ABC transporter permease [Bryobacteraceae bacterium]